MTTQGLIPALLFAGIIMIAGCGTQEASPNAAKGPEPEADNHRLLRQQGYKDIVLKGWVPFKCSDSDNMLYTDAFEATAPNGEKVSGTICGAILKGKTIRLN